MSSDKEFSGITNAERKVFQQVSDILKKYAQVDNLAAGKALTLLKRITEPFEKVIKKAGNAEESAESQE